MLFAHLYESNEAPLKRTYYISLQAFKEGNETRRSVYE